MVQYSFRRLCTTKYRLLHSAMIWSTSYNCRIAASSRSCRLSVINGVLMLIWLLTACANLDQKLQHAKPSWNLKNFGRLGWHRPRNLPSASVQSGVTLGLPSMNLHLARKLASISRLRLLSTRLPPLYRKTKHPKRRMNVLFDSEFVILQRPSHIGCLILSGKGTPSKRRKHIRTLGAYQKGLTNWEHDLSIVFLWCLHQQSFAMSLFLTPWLVIARPLPLSNNTLLLVTLHLIYCFLNVYTG